MAQQLPYTTPALCHGGERQSLTASNPDSSCLEELVRACDRRGTSKTKPVTNAAHLIAVKQRNI